MLHLKQHIMKNLMFAMLLAIQGISLAQNATGELIGKVINEDSMALSNTLVYSESNGIVYKDLTDLNGKFRISAIPAGKYIFNIVSEGDTMRGIKVEIQMDGIENLNTIQFERTGKLLDVFTIKYNKEEYKSLKYGVMTEIRVSAEQIKINPLKFNQKAMIAAMSSEIKMTDDGELVFRGARKGDMIYMMDGVKMNDISNVPSASIGGMMIYTGGIPAKYGDTTGGVVVMETKSYFDLYRAWKSNQNE